jgi:hypothetical protein
LSLGHYDFILQNIKLEIEAGADTLYNTYTKSGNAPIFLKDGSRNVHIEVSGNFTSNRTAGNEYTSFIQVDNNVQNILYTGTIERQKPHCLIADSSARGSSSGSDGGTPTTNVKNILLTPTTFGNTGSHVPPGGWTTVHTSDTTNAFAVTLGENYDRCYRNFRFFGSCNLCTCG